MKDEPGDPPDVTHNYVSVIGMMQHLRGHSAPDITYAASQSLNVLSLSIPQRDPMRKPLRGQANV